MKFVFCFFSFRVVFALTFLFNRFDNPQSHWKFSTKNWFYELEFHENIQLKISGIARVWDWTLVQVSMPRLLIISGVSIYKNSDFYSNFLSYPICFPFYFIHPFIYSHVYNALQPNIHNLSEFSITSSFVLSQIRLHFYSRSFI